MASKLEHSADSRKQVEEEIEVLLCSRTPATVEQQAAVGPNESVRHTLLRERMSVALREIESGISSLQRVRADVPLRFPNSSPHTLYPHALSSKS